MLLKELIIKEALTAKEKQEIVAAAAELLEVNPSEVINATKLWDALYWKPETLATKELGTEKLTLRGERGDGKVRVVHVLRTAAHDNILYTTMASLKAFVSSEKFADDMQYHLKDENGDKNYAQKVLDKYEKLGLAPQFVIDNLKKLTTDHPELEDTVQRFISKYKNN